MASVAGSAAKLAVGQVVVSAANKADTATVNITLFLFHVFEPPASFLSNGGDASNCREISTLLVT